MGVKKMNFLEAEDLSCSLDLKLELLQHFKKGTKEYQEVRKEVEEIVEELKKFFST